MLLVSLQHAQHQTPIAMTGIDASIQLRLGWMACGRPQHRLRRPASIQACLSSSFDFLSYKAFLPSPVKRLVRSGSSSPGS